MKNKILLQSLTFLVILISTSNLLAQKEDFYREKTFDINYEKFFLGSDVINTNSSDYLIASSWQNPDTEEDFPSYAYSEKFFKRINATLLLSSKKSAAGKVRQGNLIGNFFKKKLVLKGRTYSILKSNVRQFISEVEVLDNTANKIINNILNIDERKAGNYKKKQELIDSLKELEENRSQLPITYWYKIKERISAEDFDKIKKYVSVTLPRKIRKKSLRLDSFESLGLSLDSDSDIDFDAGTGEIFGFASTELVTSEPNLTKLGQKIYISAMGRYIARLGGECGGICYWTKSTAAIEAEDNTIIAMDNEFLCGGDADSYVSLSGQHQNSYGSQYCIESEHEVGLGQFQQISEGNTKTQILGQCTTQGQTDDMDQLTKCITYPIDTNPTVSVTEVGFKNDHKLKRYPQGTDIDPNDDEPTWKSTISPDDAVAYNKDTKPTTFAKLTINPIPTNPISAKLRVSVQNGGQLAVEDITLTGSSILVNDIDFTAHLDNDQRPKSAKYWFDWEISLDNGQTWDSIGESDHIIHWTFATPKPMDAPNCENDSTPRNCTFVNKGGTVEYAGLFDFALEKALEGLDTNTQTDEAIAKRIAKKIDEQITYDPKDSDSDEDHPLAMYDNSDLKAQCAAHANLLGGLLRSIGIDAEAVYFWGGNPNSTTEHQGGKYYLYEYSFLEIPNSPSSLVAGPVSFKTERPSSNENGVKVKRNPHFSYHAVVKVNNKYFDPSYGENLYTKSYYPYTSIILNEVVNLDNPASPKFKTKKSQTGVFTVTDVDWLDICTPSATRTCSSNTVRTLKLCTHRYRPKTSPIFRFDNDDRSDYAVWRASNNEWYIKKSSDDSTVVDVFGLSTDKIVPADYDGDGIVDISVWRPSSGIWYIKQSTDGVINQIAFGLSGDKPVYGDFDGDAKSDVAVFRESTGTWYWQYSSDGSFHSVTFGTSGDIPVSGDYDGDEKTDITLYRPSNGTWHRLNSSDLSYVTTQFGISEDIPVSGDFDNDDKTDIALFRPSNRVWHILGSTDGYSSFQFGDLGDIPSVGDYDEDGIPDATVWTPSTGRWRSLSSDTGNIIEDNLGNSSDFPLSAAFNR